MKKLIYSLALVFLSIQLPAQNFQWAHSIGSVMNEPENVTMTIDGNGNIYLAGFVMDSVYLNGFWLYGSFIAKFNSSGQLTFAFNTLYSAYKIAVDSSGNIISWAGGASLKKYNAAGNLIFNKSPVDSTCGHYMVFGGLYDFCLDPGGNIYATGVKWDGNMGGSWIPFIYKLDTIGNFVWSYESNCVNGLGNGWNGRKIMTDMNGNIIITGYFGGTQHFHNGTIVLPVGVSVIKVDTAYNLIWGTYLFNTLPLGNGIEFGFAMNTDVTNNIYFGLIGPNKDSLFLAKLDNAGTLLMSKNFYTWHDMDMGGIVPTTNGSFLIATNFTLPVWLSGFNFTSNGSSDFLLSYFDSQGNFQFAHQFGNICKDSITAMVNDQGGSVYLAGNFGFGSLSGTLNLGNILLTSNGHNDIFIAKIAPSLTATNIHDPHQNFSEIVPNPFHDNASFYFNDNLHSDQSKLLIYDITGNRIRESHLINGVNFISRRGIDSGMYFYKVTDGINTISTGKFIIE